MEKFTIDEFKEYVKMQDSLGDVMFNMTPEKIREAQVVRTTETVTFNNCFRNWIEVFYEAVGLIVLYQHGKKKFVSNLIDNTQNLEGSCGMYDLAEQWTNEFEELHKDVQWGEEADWFETVDIFMYKKALGEEYTLDMMAKY